MRSFTARACLGLLAAGALAGGLLAAGPAGATSTATAPHWRVSVITPPANPASAVTAVACPTSTWCTAAGWDGSQAPEIGNSANFALTESRGRWSRPATFALPPNADPGQQGNVNGIACTAKGSCVAVGDYVASGTGTDPGFIAIEQHGIWQTPFRPRLPRNAAAQTDSVLYAVTCTGPGYCEAVGSYYRKNGQSAPMSVTESAGRWRRGTGIEFPRHTTPGPINSLASIACTRAGSCVAVGRYSTTDGDSYAAASVRQVRGRWLRAASLKLPAGAGPVSQLNSVSCQPSGQCVAVGTWDSRDGLIHSMMATLTHGRWSKTRLLRRVPRGAPAGTLVALSAVSCARKSCLAAGAYTLKNGKRDWIVIRIRAGAWASATKIGVPAGNPGTLELPPAVDAASCSRSGACAIVGSFQNESGDSQALAAISG
ncbi:MAG TPA: hypothetical protein VMA72_16915 [Streptosporangiaceae bacterium]|nr:hypothetical protein [Streptosporangiaceae bacterium]